MKIIENYETATISYDYLITDETGIYGADFRDIDFASDYRTYILDPETKAPIADTSTTQVWTEFYKRGWTKAELHAGHREAWNLPTGTEAEEKFWGSKPQKKLWQ